MPRVPIREAPHSHLTVHLIELCLQADVPIPELMVYVGSEPLQEEGSYTAAFRTSSGPAIMYDDLFAANPHARAWLAHELGHFQHRWVPRLIDRLTLKWTARRDEFRADRFAASLVGRDAFVAALEAEPVDYVERWERQLAFGEIRNPWKRFVLTNYVAFRNGIHSHPSNIQRVMRLEPQ